MAICNFAVFSNARHWRFIGLDIVDHVENDEIADVRLRSIVLSLIVVRDNPDHIIALHELLFQTDSDSKVHFRVSGHGHNTFQPEGDGQFFSL